ncbi:MAG: T9SS type A sorting domain-containing protein [Paludibacteraceae bacterium]|nr:T9SS type A sorting domain-containing protein [Paludibacteraceae bacterium]
MKVKLLITTFTIALCSLLGLQAAVEYTEVLPVGQVYLFGCQHLDAEGDYTETYTAALGGDSVVVLHITRPVPPAAITMAYTDSINQGEMYLFGCQKLDAEGTYTETLTRANGGDSIVKLTLKYIHIPEPESITVAYTDSINQGELYLFGCQKLDAEGTYTETLTRANGGDSIVKLTLKYIHIPEPESITVAYTDSINQGEMYLFGCQKLDAEGTYTETLTRANGGDSIVKLTLKYIQIPVPESITVAYTDSIDSGEVYLFGCQKLDTEGTYTETLTRANGGDSIVQLTLKVNTCVYDSVPDEPIYLCQDSSLVWNGYTFDNIVNDTILRLDTVNFRGCDSIATVEVYVHHVMLDSTLSMTVFADSSILPLTWINGISYSTTTQRHDTIRYAQTGCDSARYNLNLTVNPIDYRPVESFDTLCPDATTFNGRWQTFNIASTDTILRDSTRMNISEAGVDIRVDSVYIFKVHRLLELDSIPEADPLYVCADNNVISWRGNDYTIHKDTILVHRYESRFGCDSIYSVKVFYHEVKEDTVLDLGDVFFDDPRLPLVWVDGKTYNATTHLDSTVQYVASQCDSAHYKLDMVVLGVERREVEIKDTLCRNENIYHGRLADRTLVGDSIWTDSLRVKINEAGVDIWVDSLYKYNIVFYSQIQSLPEDLLDDVRAICGQPLDTALAERNIRAYLNNPEPGTYFDPDATITWFVKQGASYVPRAADTITGDYASIDVRCLITNTRCNYQTRITKTVAIEAPANEKTWLHGKFGHWLMMIHLDSLRNEGYTIEPEMVTWFVTDGTTSTIVNSGYYLTEDKELSGKFYAVIDAENKYGCAMTIESDTLDWSQPYHAAPIRLVPNAIAAGNEMRLENLNAAAESEISIYDAAGQMIKCFTTEGKSALDLKPQGQPGVYLVRVRCGEDKQTVRYLIK